MKKNVLNYLWEKRKALVMFFGVLLIFCIVLSLYQLHYLPKLLYSAAICMLLGLCYGFWDFYQTRKHWAQLYEASLNTENLPSLLPIPRNNVEKQYFEILTKLHSDLQKLHFNTEMKTNELKDYYTLWAHQIKIPISAMRLLLQNTDQQTHPYAITEELFKIEQYVEMVLHYLRLESMASDMLIKSYELYDIVGQAVKKHAVLFINSKLSFQLESFTHKVITDEKWLLFVLEQLISNAVKYTRNGKISIYLEDIPNIDIPSSAPAENRKMVSEQKQLVIEDTGIGIRPEDLPRIFEKGFTGYNGRLDKKSTGLGLYLCKQILDKLSHRIEVRSELGKGTKLILKFY